MAGRRTAYLERRGRVYYVRLPVPIDLRVKLCRSELRWSLHSTDHATAAVLASKANLAFRALCARVRGMSEVQEHDIRAALGRYYERYVKNDPQPAAHGGRKRAAAESIIEDQIAGLQALIECDGVVEADDDLALETSALAQRETTLAATEAQLAIEAIPEGLRAMLAQGVARALIEQRRQFQHRLADRLTPYEPSETIFATFAPVHPVATQAAGLTLDAALKQYECAKTDVQWKPRTVREKRRVMRWMRDYFGLQTAVAEIKRPVLREFRDALISLRRHGEPNAEFESLTGAADADAIDRVTAAKYFRFAASAFNWLAKEGLIATSPAAGLSVLTPKSKKASARTSFNLKQLECLFSSPMYVGCLSSNRRMTPGKHVIRDGFYWIPLIGALSGMRLGEIVQLALEDIELDGSVPKFVIRENPALGGTVKSDAGWRDVPIHRRLKELGFKDFVEARRAADKHARLFFEVPYGSDGSPSAEYSRWFGRRLDQIGLSQRGLVFHSFRGSFIGALTEIGAPAYVIKAIVGHDQSDDMTFGYSGHEGVSIAKRGDWINQVTYLDHLPVS
jgi:integrase